MICVKDLAKRFKKKTTWVSIAALVVLLSKAFGWHLPDNFDGIFNAFMAVLAAIGVISDPLTEDDLCEKYGICLTKKGGEK